MTDDLVTRLKEAHRLMRRPLLREAANRIEQLEAALRPFAAAADTLDKEGWDNLHIEGSNADVTGEHCRVARAALEGKDVHPHRP
jgi:hypothetical protein